MSGKMIERIEEPKLRRSTVAFSNKWLVIRGLGLERKVRHLGKMSSWNVMDR